VARTERSNGTLVDSNVLLDLMTRDDVWLEWSRDALGFAAESGPLYINPIIYAEVSVRFTSVEELDLTLPTQDYRRAPLPWAAAFLAGKAFVHYRRQGGRRSSPLPDFFIGAHAAVANLDLLTRDPSRYRTFFPTLGIVAPNDGGRPPR
jgi:predicted nucleic acid-binding protein